MPVYLPHLLLFYAAKKGINLAPGFFEKIGLREMPLDLSQKLSVQSFPQKSLYNFIILFSMLLYLLFSIFLSFMTVFSFFEFQKNLFGMKSIYFASENSGLFALLFFGSLVICYFFLALIFLKKISPSTFSNYILSEQLKVGYDLDFGSSAKIVLFSLILYILLSLPPVFLLLRDYRAVFENRVVANVLFDFANREYSLDEIHSVYLKSEPAAGDVFITYSFLFDDGRNIIFGKRSAISSNLVDFTNLYNFLRTKKVTLEIDKPSADALRLIQERTCPSRQLEFQSLFEVEWPIQPKSGCD